MSLDRLRQILADFFARLSKRREERIAIRIQKIRAERQALGRRYLAARKSKRAVKAIRHRLTELTNEELQIGSHQ